MAEEILEVSEQYKKAFNQVDKLARYMPHILEGIEMSDDKGEYSKGFRDRLEIYHKERDIGKNHPYQKLNKTYGKNIPNPQKDRGKSKDDRNY